MNRIYRIVLCACSLACLLVGSGCKKDKGLGENPSVPRLMAEKRGVNYGSMSAKELRLPVSKTLIYVEKEPLVNEFDILNVELVQVELGKALLLQLSEKGSRDLYRASVSNNGSRIVLTVNGNPIGARRITGSMESGDFYTFVELPEKDLGQLVIDMKETLENLQMRKASGW